ncbi:branched-chain alpha-ketoacid dehydrogenase [Gilbertella persicaria]|uniref:branched-chain alpha-ketoacid dehydrogenase n=1 Tax=Gilbertella persicaria TaxID=101096 RepID=UPI00221EF7E0|nr:branched-chain alpha-ketoacid dehydrogenase [Gilbertella persicaria]KAI8066296.1 branched-chain alpha-ketoacid dehydrogenase [Gilbertella persicaria]
MNTDRLLKSANWVRNELLVRLAHRIRDFQQLPFFVGTNPHIEYVYKLYWGAFESLRTFPPIATHNDNTRFCDLLRNLLEDGLLVLPRLAQGLSESAAYYPPEKKDLDLFLSRMLRSRVSRRILAEQHIALAEACEHDWDHHTGFGDGYVGIIFVHCSASQIVERSKNLVYQHVHRYQEQSNDVPPIQVHIQHNGFVAKHSKDEILFAYVPEQLEHILYELLDNAVRFTMQKHPSGNYPPIQVTVSANDSDVYFRVSDQGGGMAKERYDCLWSYQSRAQVGDFKNFKQVQKLPASIDERASQASEMRHRHLGVGLTMSRVYAEYWGGELQVLTMDGYGTDAYVRIPRLGTNAENLGIERQSHPVFHNSIKSGSSITGTHKKKKSTKDTVKKELRLKSSGPSLKFLSPEQQLLDTSLTSESFSGNGWSESHMIQS